MDYITDDLEKQKMYDRELAIWQKLLQRIAVSYTHLKFAIFVNYVSALSSMLEI